LLARLPLRGGPGAGDAGGGGTAARVRVWWVFLSRRGGGADSREEEASTVAEERDGVGLLRIGNWDLGWLGWVGWFQSPEGDDAEAHAHPAKRARVWPHVQATNSAAVVQPAPMTFVAIPLLYLDS
jgi:hypothetical protein